MAPAASQSNKEAYQAVSTGWEHPNSSETKNRPKLIKKFRPRALFAIKKPLSRARKKFRFHF